MYLCYEASYIYPTVTVSFDLETRDFAISISCMCFLNSPVMYRLSGPLILLCIHGACLSAASVNKDTKISHMAWLITQHGSCQRYSLKDCTL